MKLKIRNLLTKALLSRFLILSLDLAICLFSLYAANLLRFNFNPPPHVFDSLPYTMVYVLVVRFIPFYFLKTYAGIIKFTGEQDAKAVLSAVSWSTFFFIFIYLILRSYQLGDYFLFFYPLSIILIDYLMVSFMLIAYRVSIKLIIEEIRASRSGKSQKKNIAIFGAGKTGVLIKKALESDKSSNIVAWFDDNPFLVNKMLEGQRIYHASKDFKEVIRKKNIEMIILSMQQLDSARKQRFINACLDLNVKMMSSPPVSTWLEGKLDIRKLKKFNIEDVLERDPIILDTKYLEFQIAEKCVMVTGAAGSIGSEIVRQLARFKPNRIIMVDVAESPLVELGLEVEEKLKFPGGIHVVADVSNYARLHHVFEEFKPEIVYHAAAYKHVPMMEHNPYEAVRVNVMGTKNVADLSVLFRVERFVMISTDKAVNPTNIMGCSKRIAEIYTQSLNNNLKENGNATRFITTRFGNVLGSNGSVIPRFQKQIEAGGPITVTDPEITRFFMTIPEACQLVLEAGAMGKGGEIFIFDMGKPVRIVDMAEKMIRLSGMEPYKDIEIVFTGLRPGEKLEEELLAKKENILPTHHDKIMRAKVREYNFADIESEIQKLLQLLNEQKAEPLVLKMKEIVPEYVSNNSVFEKLDDRLNLS